MANSIQDLNSFGQSVWLDNINRSMITSGKLKNIVAQGLRGMTSNPTIFNKAITAGTDYDQHISKLCAQGKEVFAVYDDLTVKDIQDAADIFAPVYKESGGLDGYVSLEINPQLADNTEETIKEGLRLYQKVNRPNLMLKVPATEQGYPAVEELTAKGANVNTTLIFSLAQYEKTAQAYLRGIKRILQDKGQVSKVRSVASVFVSRIDTLVDKLLDQKLSQEKDEKEKSKLTVLKGKAAVANCSLIYKKYEELFISDEFRLLEQKGANLQRVLWGSTSTKSPAYSDIKYVDELVAKDTVNTMPENTFDAFLDHGQVEAAKIADAQKSAEIIAQLNGLEIDIDIVCAQLLKDGVIAFEQSFDSLLKSLEEKEKILCKR